MAPRPKYLGCLLGQAEQDWKCLLSKQGAETPRPGGLAEAGEGAPPTPGSSPRTWQTAAAVCPSLSTEDAWPRHAMRVALSHTHPWGQSGLP